VTGAALVATAVLFAAGIEAMDEARPTDALTAAGVAAVKASVGRASSIASMPAAKRTAVATKAAPVTKRR